MCHVNARQVDGTYQIMAPGRRIDSLLLTPRRQTVQNIHILLWQLNHLEVLFNAARSDGLWQHDTAPVDLVRDEHRSRRHAILLCYSVNIFVFEKRGT